MCTSIIYLIHLLNSYKTLLKIIANFIKYKTKHFAKNYIKFLYLIIKSSLVFLTLIYSKWSQIFTMCFVIIDTSDRCRLQWNQSYTIEMKALACLLSSFCSVFLLSCKSNRLAFSQSANVDFNSGNYVFLVNA